MPASPAKIVQLEQQYFKEAEEFKRKLLKGKQWKRLLEERNSLTRLAIAICEDHQKPYTRERLLFGEMND